MYIYFIFLINIFIYNNYAVGSKRLKDDTELFLLTLLVLPFIKNLNIKY